MTKNCVYLDNASATEINNLVLKEMDKVFKRYYSNPSALHEGGIIVKEILKEARSDIAKILNCHRDEIIFTSGATESNNLAILGAVENFDQKNKL